jgi:mono/diheme cytochrome c family protein
MKKVFTPLVFTLMTVVIVFFTSSGFKIQPNSEWVAPPWADTIKNPFKGNAIAAAEGKKIYASYCVVCHGDKGKGNGIAAAGLNAKPADHTSAKFQKQTDGAIFWKLTKGRTPMPMVSYENTLTVTQRWQVVNYIRTLKAAK